MHSFNRHLLHSERQAAQSPALALLSSRVTDPVAELLLWPRSSFKEQSNGNPVLRRLHLHPGLPLGELPFQGYAKGSQP